MAKSFSLINICKGNVTKMLEKGDCYCEYNANNDCPLAQWHVVDKLLANVPDKGLLLASFVTHTQKGNIGFYSLYNMYNMVIGSDQGPHFTAVVSETMCMELEIENAQGSPEHVQSQGQVERQNQLFANIRAVCNKNPASWPRAMHVGTFAHNTSVNKTTEVSPHELVFKNRQGGMRHSCFPIILRTMESGDHNTCKKQQSQVRRVPMQRNWTMFSN